MTKTHDPTPSIAVLTRHGAFSFEAREEVVA